MTTIFQTNISSRADGTFAKEDIAGVVAHRVDSAPDYYDGKLEAADRRIGELINLVGKLYQALDDKGLLDDAAIAEITPYDWKVLP